MILSKDKAKVEVLKEDRSLFSRLYIACQIRDGNMEDFFKYENQLWALSLTCATVAVTANSRNYVHCCS